MTSISPAAKESKRYAHEPTNEDKNSVIKGGKQESMGKKLFERTVVSTAKNAEKATYRTVERPHPVALCKKKMLIDASIVKDTAVATATL